MGMLSIFDVIVWMAFGAILLAIQWGIRKYLLQKGKATILLQITGFIANFLLVFSLAWGYSSFVEREYQAVAMGFLFFGGAGVIPAVYTYKAANSRAKDSSASVSA